MPSTSARLYKPEWTYFYLDNCNLKHPSQNQRLACCGNRTAQKHESNQNCEQLLEIMPVLKQKRAR